MDRKFSFLMNTPLGSHKENITYTPECSTLREVFASIFGTNEFAGGSVDGDEYFFSVKADTQMGAQTFEVKDSLEGDELTGVIKSTLGAFPYERKHEKLNTW